MFLLSFLFKSGCYSFKYKSSCYAKQMIIEKNIIVNKNIDVFNDLKETNNDGQAAIEK